MYEPIHILGFSGSLRKGSYNTAALHAARELMPEGMVMEIFDLSPIPLYNADLDTVYLPRPVKEFKRRIEAADAVLIASPEYNFSVSGVLKNAIDWASRPSGSSPLRHKPAAIMGVSTGSFGTVRAQMHLRQILLATNTSLVQAPQVLIMNAGEKFDKQGHLIDETSRELIAQLLDELLRLTQEATLARV